MKTNIVLISLVIYLKLTLPSVSERLGDLTRRGVSLRKDQTLADLYRERTPLYEMYADIVIDAEHMDIRHIVAEISSLCMTEQP